MKHWNQPPARLFFSADREEPGSVNENSIFRYRQHSNNDRNHFFISKSEKSPSAVRKLMQSTKGIGKNLQNKCRSLFSALRATQ